MEKQKKLKDKKIKCKTKFGFTLVELIVVISILAILWTIAFISFNNYFWNARDSVRVTDLKTIHKWIVLFSVWAWVVPLPDDYISITNGTDIYSYQWYAWDNVKNIAKVSWKAVDPKDGLRYTYATDSNKKKVQLLSYLENWDNVRFISSIDTNILDRAFADELNFSNRQVFVVWDMIWVITDENKVPVQVTNSWSLNILDQDNPDFTTYFGWDVYEWWKSTATGQTLETQIFAAITNSLPCSATTYNDYVIPPTIDGNILYVDKNFPITNWDGTKKQLTIKCLNWAFDTTNATESQNTICNTWYLPDGDACIADVCWWTFDQNTSESNATWQSVSKTWHYSATWDICTFTCKENYSWDTETSTCKADTKASECLWLDTNWVWNTVASITQTWNGTDWAPTLVWVYSETASTTTCNFKCNSWYTWDSTNNICKADDCTMPATDTYSTLTYNIPTPLALLHWNTETKIWTRTFWTSPTNWTVTANFPYTCTAWVLTEWATTAWAWTCWTWYSFNNNWTTPACNVMTCIFDDAWSLFWDWTTNYCYFQ